MCLLAIHFQVCPEAPLLIAANREEYYARPSLPPAIQAGRPRVLCGVDARAGGTWLGVNEHGLVVAVTNRAARPPLSAAGALTLAATRSRGLLCRDLLDFDRARTAAQFAIEQLASGAYDGANFICLDPEYGAVIHAGRKLEVIELPPGLHLLTSGDVNDATDHRQALARRLFGETAWAGPREFVQAAKQVCSRGRLGDCSGIVVRGDGRGTVSSMILALTRQRDESMCYFAPGPPDTTPYEDGSGLIRSLLKDH